MMREKYIVMSILMFTAVHVYGAVLNVPGDYSSIQEAVDAAVDSDTVLVAAGTYTENINFNGKSIVLGSWYITTGDTSYISATILDGAQNGSVVEISSNEDSTTAVSGLTIRNGKANSGGGVYIEDSDPRICSCRIINNTAECSNGIGGGIFCKNSSPVIQECEIAWNAAIGKDESNGWGGGIGIYLGSALIRNCYIHGNTATYGNAGIGVSGAEAVIQGCVITKNRGYACSGVGCQNSEMVFINNTLANNYSSESEGFYFIQSSPVIRNSIIWFNSNKYGYQEIGGWGGTPDITFSNIQDGWGSLPLLEENPVFIDTAHSNFRLDAGSPCIDAGTNDITECDLPALDLWGNPRVCDGDNDGAAVVDMGACEYVYQPVGVREDNSVKNPESLFLLASYPNPFNLGTRITFHVPLPGQVRISVYDITGRLVDTVFNQNSFSGNKTVSWDGSGQPSGTYLISLKSGKTRLIRKCLLLK